MQSFRVKTQEIRIRDDIDNPFEATLRRWEKYLLCSDRKIFKVCFCGDLCHGSPNSSTEHALWELITRKCKCLQRSTIIHNAVY
jgi:hypothetical protein